jgi:cytosine/adenosine deaminase-related metal-dependent hydrolase
MKIHAADHILPISSKPFRNGAIAVDGQKIAAVGSKDEIVKSFPDAAVEDHGDAVIMPGLVNCHSHLEITALRGALDEVENDFRSWLLRLNDLRSAMTVEDIRGSAVAGAIEGAQAGVTCFGDIGRIGEAGVAALKTLGLRGIVFQESEFSPDNRTAEADFVDLAGKYEELRTQETDLVNVGISPHSPYTVSSRLFEMIAQYSIINRVPLSIHAAESAEENDLLTRGTGFFTGVYEKFGMEWHSPQCTPIEYLDRLGVLSARPLLAHCVTVDDRDLERIAANGAKIAHCPKSNAKFGHGLAPFERMLDAGIHVGLGSDSVASNNLCDLFEEARFASLAARNRPGSGHFISSREMLETATLGGARALGLDGKVGSLEAGKDADIAVVSLSSVRQRPVTDIYAALIFSTSAADVTVTMVAGNEVYRSVKLGSVTA